MVLAGQGVVGVSIEPEGQEVVVVEQVVCFLMDLPLQMVCNHVGMFLVVPVP